jgi:hypothetical protein
LPQRIKEKDVLWEKKTEEKVRKLVGSHFFILEDGEGSLKNPLK